MGERRNAHKVLVGESGGKNHLEDLVIDGRIRLDHKEVGWEVVEWIYQSHNGEGVVPCEYDNEILVSIKGWEFADRLSNHHVLKKDSAPCR
jgi:hypothetical protein